MTTVVILILLALCLSMGAALVTMRHRLSRTCRALSIETRRRRLAGAMAGVWSREATREREHRQKLERVIEHAYISHSRRSTAAHGA